MKRFPFICLGLVLFLEKNISLICIGCVYLLLLNIAVLFRLCPPDKWYSVFRSFNFHTNSLKVVSVFYG